MATFKHARHKGLPIVFLHGIGGGAAAFRPQVRAFDTANAAFDRADRAVYHAKESGRNRVCCHDALSQAGVLEPGERSGEIELF